MELNEFLENIGLTQYEKQAYLTLLNLGRSKSRQISKESKVSYGRIYEILENLEEKGLISIIPTEPKTFEAIDPKVSFKLFLKKKSDEINQLGNFADTFSFSKKQSIEKNEDKTIILHGKQKQLSMVTDMDERAKKEILVIPGEYKSLVTKIPNQRALKRGVKVKRILREVNSDNIDIIKENLNLKEEIRQNELSGLRLHIIDRKEAMITIVDPKTKDRISLYTTNQAFANSMAIFFDSLWEKSRNISLK